MGEEVQMTEYENVVEDDEDANDRGNDDDHVFEWEAGLPAAADLTPLSQALISPELASAFSISPEPCRTLLDVIRASQSTLASLRGTSAQPQGFSTTNNNNFKSFAEDHTIAVEQEDADRSDSRKLKRTESPEEADSAQRTENSADDPSSARTSKRPRLVWTPQLHKRFVEVVAHLGIKNAVPKTIMQLMNVEGLTRENVASHLQKYRLYLKRMQGGLSTEGPSSSDQLFASIPVPQSLHENGGASGGGHGNGHMPIPIPMPYGAQPMMPMPVYRMNNHGHMGMQMGNAPGYQSNPYMLQQMDWSGNTYASVGSYPQSSTPNEK